MHRDEAADPPALVCQVGKTQLRYHLRCIEDLHAMLTAHGDWMPLRSADEQNPSQEPDSTTLPTSSTRDARAKQTPPPT